MAESHWNHRVVRREYPDAALVEDRVQYGIHEAYYHNDVCDAITQEPVAVTSSAPDGLLETLERMRRALQLPILDYETRQEIP